MKKYILLIVLLAYVNSGLIAQKQSDLDLLYWSAKHKIAIDDFGIRSEDGKKGLSSAAFSLEYNVHGLNFLTKNFNKKVRHYMIRSASQVTLDGNQKNYIRYQQTLFDLEEIYVRKFRQALRENRKKLVFKTEIADDLKHQIIDIALMHRQTQYNNDTNSGKDLIKQEAWEKQILKELDELSDFVYEK